MEQYFRGVKSLAEVNGVWNPSAMFGKGYQMNFYYAKEWKLFVIEWEKKWEEYRQAGMSDADIRKLYEFDLEEFRRRRTYSLHNESREALEEKQNPIYMESIRFEDNEQLGVGIDNWLDELDNEKLYKAIQKLKKEDFEILTLWAIERYSVTEIAKLKKVSQPTISKKVLRIKNFLKKYCEKAMD